MVKADQILTCEVRQPSPSKESVERYPYQEGKNLSIVVEGNVSYCFENLTIPTEELPTLKDTIESDPEIIIDDLMTNLRAGGKVTW